MRLRILTSPQNGASYDDALAAARLVERLGFDAFFRADHLSRLDGVQAPPGTTDAWTTLAGLARETSRIRLGTLMSSATCRHPGLLAVQVAQVDAMSGGRVELGLGAGWVESEHREWGIPFPSRRLERLEEQLAIITGIWATPWGKRFDFAGEHYQLKGNPGVPKPVQRPLPIIVGGTGPVRTPAIAARYATEFNLTHPKPGEIELQFARIQAACESIGRDPASLPCTLGLAAIIGSDETTYRNRAAARGWDPEALRREALGGTAEEVLERIAGFEALGVGTIYLHVPDTRDLETIETLGEALMGHV